MHIGIEFVVVVADHKLLQQRHGLVVAGFAEQHGDALFQRQRVYRMAKAHLRDGFLQRRVLRVLIKLGLGDLRGEWRAVERERVIRHPHLRRKHQRGVEAHREVLAHRPIVVRPEDQFRIAAEGPATGQFRPHLDAGRHWLADQRQHRCRSGEAHSQRMHHDRGGAVVGEAGRSHLQRHRHRLRRPGLRLPPAVAERPDRHHRQQRRHDAGVASRPRAHGCRRRRETALHRRQPSRGLPIDPPDDQRQPASNKPDHRQQQCRQRHHRRPHDIHQTIPCQQTLLALQHTTDPHLWRFAGSKRQCGTLRIDCWPRWLRVR